MANNNGNGRKIDTSRAKAHSTNPYGEGYRGTSRNVSKSRAQTASNNGRKRKKTKTSRNILIAMLLFLLLVAGVLGGLYLWVSGSINSGEQGTIQNEIKTAPEFKGDVVNLLVLGVDFEEGRTAKMTDMIMYVTFDVKNNSFNMLQIPRDTFAGENVSTGGTGKLNSIYWHAEDKANPVNALAKEINAQYKLPVDYYVTIEMESLKKIVDTFGGLDVYVPRDMAYKGSALKQGMRTLNGDAAEFFVRCRYGDGFERADIDRIEMQRYFYSALFRRLRTMTIGDCMKLIPHFVDYVNTDMPMDVCVSLGLKLLNVPSSNIMMSRLPVSGAAEKYNGNSIVVAAPTETAELLNTYFRMYTGLVDVTDLDIAQRQTSGPVIDAAIQYMGDVEATETN